MAATRPSASRSADDAKRRVAEASLAYVRDGMRVGLGSGSTAELMVEALGRQVAQGLSIVAVATSRRTERLARAAGIDVRDFETVAGLDVAIDGADEVAPDLGLLKGHGGALLYEKIVASAARELVIVVDASKCVDRLGARALPIEVVPFARPRVAASLEAMGARVSLRPARADSPRPFRTQAGHQILDADFGPLADPAGLAAALDGIPGIVEHGLFLGLATRVLVAEPDRIRTLEARRPRGERS